MWRSLLSVPVLVRAQFFLKAKPAKPKSQPGRKQVTSTSHASNQSIISFLSMTPSEEPIEVRCNVPKNLDNSVIFKVEANTISPQRDTPMHTRQEERTFLYGFLHQKCVRNGPFLRIFHVKNRFKFDISALISDIRIVGMAHFRFLLVSWQNFDISDVIKSAVSFGNFAETECFGRETKGFFHRNVNISSQFLQKERTKFCLIIHRKNIARFCVVFTSEMCKKWTDSMLA